MNATKIRETADDVVGLVWRALETARTVDDSPVRSDGLGGLVGKLHTALSAVRNLQRVAHSGDGRTVPDLVNPNVDLSAGLAALVAGIGKKLSAAGALLADLAGDRGSRLDDGAMRTARAAVSDASAVCVQYQRRVAERAA